jgi:flagellar biosynthesis protein FlhA
MNPRISRVAVPFGIVAIVMVMVVPLPVMLIDMLLAANIAISIMVLLTSMLVREPLEFSVFPALLLVTTLFRLALNVSTTRLVLSSAEGGKLIEAFGGYVVAGNLVIGLVIFLILVVIQFAVVTNGSGRVAEVAARFTLDAMPGKQMAIDADLNAGLIDDVEARRRRAHVGQEADFFRSMDGASKFVKGDAIASVVIVIVNLLGGILVGVFQHGLSIGESASRYSLLSVGDGLVSQIPALLVSVASGLIVTRAVSEGDGGLGSDLWGQLFHSRRVLGIAAAVVGSLALMPGLPKVPFILIVIVLLVARSRAAAIADPAAPIEEEAVVAPRSEDDELRNALRVEPLEFELAADLFDLADPERGGNLLERVRSLRRQIAEDLGVVLPLVRTRDNLLLPPSTYVIRLHGVEIGRGEAPPGHVLVLHTDDVHGLPAPTTRDPVFGLPATWVSEGLADHYLAQRATVIDRASVIITHLSEVARRHAGDLLTRQDTQKLLDALKETAPAVADEIGGTGLSLAELQSVLRSLLDEGISIRDLVRVAEAVTARARDSRDLEGLVEAARLTLAGTVCANAQHDGVIAAVTFDPLVEHLLVQTRRLGEGGSFFDLDPGRMEQVLNAIGRALERAEERHRKPVVVCSGPIRPAVRRLVAASGRTNGVLSYAELVPSFTVQPVEVISLEQEHASI